MEGATARDPV